MIIKGIRVQQELPQGIDLIYRFNAKGQFTYLNQQALDVFGMPKDEIIGRSYLDFIREDYRDRVSAFYQKQVHLKQASTYFELPFKAGDKVIWVGQSIELLYENESVKELLGVARAISELKQVKKDLRQKDQNLLAFMKHLDAAILIEDTNGYIRYANQNFCDYFRLSRKPAQLEGVKCSLIGLQLASFFVDSKKHSENSDQLLKNQQIKRAERLELKDERVFERDYIPMFNDDSNTGHLWVYRDVTMRYLTEQAIIESEKKYREVIHNIDLGLMEVDTQETILWANDPFLKATGYSMADIKGLNAKELFLNEADLELHNKSLNSVQELRDEGQSSAYELPIRNKEMERVWMMISGAPIKDISGKVTGSLGIHHNITPLKELQNQLEYRLRLQSILLELANELIFLKADKETRAIGNALGRIGTFVNADRVYIFEYDLINEETSNTHEWCAEGISPEIKNLQKVPLEAIPNWFETHQEGKAMKYSDVATLAPSHPVRQILEPQGIQSIITMPIFGSGELKGFIGFDAVRVKRKWNNTENELLEFMAQILAAHFIRKEFEIKLSASEFRMRNILENALDAVITINQDGMIETWNRQAEEMFKYKAEEVIGHSLTGKIIPEKYAEAHDRGMKHFVKTGEGPVLNKRIELVGHDKHGHHFPIEFSIAPFKMDGQYYFSSFLRDITARKKAEEDMSLALEQQSEMARMKSRLISMASHEFRTPLTTIKANTDMLELWTQKVPEEYRAKSLKYIDRLSRETDRLSNIMTDILVLGRLESGKINISRKNLDLVSFVTDIIERHYSNQSDGRTLEFVLQGGPKLVKADPEMLEHIVENLVGNAFKYSPNAPNPILSLSYNRDIVRIGIKDFGIGIPAEEQNQIFTSFYRAENTRGIQGSGMGLAVVKQMCDMQHLNLHFFSELNEGSEFVFDIPLNL